VVVRRLFFVEIYTLCGDGAWAEMGHEGKTGWRVEGGKEEGRQGDGMSDVGENKTEG